MDVLIVDWTSWCYAIVYITISEEIIISINLLNSYT
jgi:hypothetical protein